MEKISLLKHMEIFLSQKSIFTHSVPAAMILLIRIKKNVKIDGEPKNETFWDTACKKIFLKAKP